MENTIPTNHGDQSPEGIISSLTYISYATQRDTWATHEQLLSIGLGNERMRLHYELEKLTTTKK